MRAHRLQWRGTGAGFFEIAGCLEGSHSHGVRKLKGSVEACLLRVESEKKPPMDHYTYLHALVGGMLIGFASLIATVLSGKVPGDLRSVWSSPRAGYSG